MRKVLVTGGAGFVGRHLIKRLLENGNEVHCVDKIAEFTGGITPKLWPLFKPLDYKSFHFYQMDCREYFNKHLDTDFDYCFHLAAMVGGRSMIENNPLAVADDLSIDAEYWEWAAKTKPRKTACFSSSAAYPVEYQQKTDHKSLTEDMVSFENNIGMPDMSYGWAKLTCEYLAKLAHQKNGIRSIIYRPFSGYGVDQDDTYPFPSICKRVIANQGKPIVTVWGTGEQMRDFIHIDDCIDAILITIDKIDNAEAVNLCTGIHTSFIDFAKIAAGICGYAPEIRGTSDKPSGVFSRVGDPTKLKQLGYEYKIKFKTGIEKAIKYYLNN